MGDGNEEVKVTDTVIDQAIEKVEDTETSDKKEISETATVVTEIAKEVLGLTPISESSLSEDQKKLATSIYEKVKEAIKGFISDPNLDNTIKITKVIGQVIRQLETTKIDGKVPSGGDKKAVAIQLGRILIKEVTPDDKGEAEILMVYDLIAEQTLEAMIEVSKVVNVAVQEVATKCCPGMLGFFKRVKTA